MAISANRKELSKKLFDVVSSFAVLAIILLGLVLLLRIFELGYNLSIHSSKVKFATLYGSVILTDIDFWCRFCFLQLLVYVPLYLVSKQLGKAVFIVVAFVYLLLQLALSQYFAQALVPLGADIFGYTYADIKQTIGASAQLSLTSIVVALVLIAAYFFAFYFIPKKISLRKNVAFSILVSAFFFVVGSSFVTIPQSAQGSEFLNNLALNKTDFFISASVKHFFPDDSENDIYADAYIGDYDDNV